MKQKIQNVIPHSVTMQSARLDTGDESTKRVQIERTGRCKDRELTAEEIRLGYHKCPICGFPTKNRYRCHGCWAVWEVCTEEELPLRLSFM